MFLSVWEKIMPCVYTYAYTEQTAVWCNMKARVELRINNFLLIQSFLTYLIANIIHSCVTLTFLNFTI